MEKNIRTFLSSPVSFELASEAEILEMILKYQPTVTNPQILAEKLLKEIPGRYSCLGIDDQPCSFAVYAKRPKRC